MPRLEGTHPLTAPEIEELRERGHVLLRGVLSPEEMAACRAFLRRYVLAREEILVGISSEAAAAEFNLGNDPPEVADFVTSPRLGEIAARLLGVEAVRVLHFCGLFKPAGGAQTPWHQDLTFIPLDTENLISAWIPLTDFIPEMGDLTFAEGSHQEGVRLSTADWERFSLAQNGPMAAGDISFHLGWTLHNAGGNTSGRLREAIGIGYYADGARIQVKREAPFMQNLLDLYFPGLAAGELAVGPMNPVVFRSVA
jgi:hypothetical protein